MIMEWEIVLNYALILIQYPGTTRYCINPIGSVSRTSLLDMAFDIRIFFIIWCQIYIMLLWSVNFLIDSLMFFDQT